MAIKVAINGFGRIGRLALRVMEESDKFDVVAINDLTGAKDLAYLLKYDTTHRRYFDDEISYLENAIIVKGHKIKVFSEKEPSNLPWGELNIDVVLECTGKFTSLDAASMHIDAGAKKVVISAPSKGDVETVVYNVNEEILDGTESVISAASCTTNCLSPVLKVIEENFGIEKGYMTTVHAYTNDQATLDVAHKKGIESRRGRASAANIVPTSTGAASAIGKVIPSLEGKLQGSALRVPVTDGSVIDLSLELKRNTTVEEINKLFKENANETLWYTEDPVVSSDIIGTSCGALVDGLLTDVLEVNGRQLVKIVAWYDNEMGYTYQMIRTMEYLFR